MEGVLEEVAGLDDLRPDTRGECLKESRPCPWVMCKYHLYLDVGIKGSLKLNFPDLGPEEIPVTCSLDIADKGGTTLDEVGNAMNLSRERIRQIEVKVIEKLQDKIRELLDD